MYIGNQPIPLASQTRYFELFVTAKQVVTIPDGYTPGNIVLFINGVLIPPTQYTATDGDTIDLGSEFPILTEFYLSEIENAEISITDAGSLDGVLAANYARTDIAEEFASDVTILGYVLLGTGTLKAHEASKPIVQLGDIGVVSQYGNTVQLAKGAYFDGANWRYGQTSSAPSYVNCGNGGVTLGVAAAGTAGDILTWTSALVASTSNVTFNIRQYNNNSMGSGIATSTGSLGQIEIVNRSDNASASVVTFHRGGSFACYFGLDTDNKLKVGGWSYGAVAHEIAHAGTRHVSKVTAITSEINWALGNLFTHGGVGGNLTITDSNRPASGFEQTIIIQIYYTTGTITWPADWKWIGGSPPTLETSKYNVITATCHANTYVISQYVGAFT